MALVDKYGVARNVLRALKFDGAFPERSWMIMTERGEAMTSLPRNAFPFKTVSWAKLN